MVFVSCLGSTSWTLLLLFDLCWELISCTMFVWLAGRQILNIVLFPTCRGPISWRLFLFHFLGTHMLHMMFVFCKRVLAQIVHIVCLLLWGAISFTYLLFHFLRVYRPWNVALVFVPTFGVECTQHHVWRPPEARDMTTFVNRVFVQRSLGVMTMVEKSIKHYIEWCSRNTKRLNIGSRYKHITILCYCDIRILQDYLGVIS